MKKLFLMLSIACLGLVQGSLHAQDAPSLWESIQENFAESSKADRPMLYILDTANELTIPEAWHRDVLPGVSLGTLHSFYWTHLGLWLIPLLLGFHVYQQSTEGNGLNPYDLFIRLFVVVGFMVGAQPLYQTLITLQMGLPKVISSVMEDSVILQTEDAGPYNAIREATNETFREVISAMVNYGSRDAPEDQMVGYMIVPLYKQLEEQEPWSAVEDQITLGTPSPGPEGTFENRLIEWKTLPAETRLVDLRKGLEAYFASDEALARDMVSSLEDVFYGDGLFKTPADTAKSSISENDIRNYKKKLHKNLLDSLERLEMIPMTFDGNTVSEWADSRGKVSAAVGTAPPSEGVPWYLQWLMDALHGLNAAIGKGILFLFTKLLHIILGLQFLVCAITLPLFMHPKTQKAFTSAFYYLILFTIIPIVGQAMVTMWGLVMRYLFARGTVAVVNDPAAGAAAVGGLMAVGGSQLLLIATIVDIAGMILLTLYSFKAAKVLLTGGSVAGAVTTAGIAGAIGGKAAMALAGTTGVGAVASLAAQKVAGSTVKGPSIPEGGTQSPSGTGAAQVPAPSSVGGSTGAAKVPAPSSVGGSTGVATRSDPRARSEASKVAQSKQTMSPSSTSSSTSPSSPSSPTGDAPSSGAVPSSGTPSSGAAPASGGVSGGAAPAAAPAAPAAALGMKAAAMKGLALGGNGLLTMMGAPRKGQGRPYAQAYQKAITGAVLDVAHGGPTQMMPTSRKPSFNSGAAANSLQDSDL